MWEQRYTVVGIGEALFDVFEGQSKLGGAPLNVAVQAHQLGKAVPGGVVGVVVSRVGQDRLGDEVLDELKRREMPIDFIQTDPDHPTSRVYVDIDEDGEVNYDIVENVAWDWLQFDPDLELLGRECNAVCFGSLAQRNAQTRNNIYRFAESARQAIRLFDVNLRPPYVTADHIRRSCEIANVIKLNESELPQICEMLGIHDVSAEGEYGRYQRAEVMRKRYDCKAVVLTRGKKGTVIINDDGIFEGAAADLSDVRTDDQADPVGAGDAVSAAVIIGMLRGKPPQAIADFANRVGAYVAHQAGATPALPESIAGI